MTQGYHPTDDLLADLAAEVLPPDEAHEVQTHVQSCQICLNGLSDAEVVRSALLQVPVDPMPDDVVQRLLDVVMIESDARSGAVSSPRPPAGPAGYGRPDRSEFDETAQFTSVFAPAKGADLVEQEGALAASAAAREARWSEGGAQRPLVRPTLRRPRGVPAPRRSGMALRVFGLAATALVVVGAGTYALHTGLLGGSGSASSGAAEAVRSTAAADTTVEAVQMASGTAYTADGLADAAAELLETSTRPDAGSEASEVANGSPLATADGIATCLEAVGTTGGTVMTVDYATYDGAQAAVLLVSLDGSTYQAWVVSPQCGTGSQAALDYVQFTR